MVKRIIFIISLGLFMICTNSCKKCSADDERANTVPATLPPEYQNWFSKIPITCIVSSNNGLNESFSIDKHIDFLNTMKSDDIECGRRKGISMYYKYTSSIYGHSFALTLNLTDNELLLGYYDQNYGPMFICNTFSKNLLDKTSNGWVSVISDTTDYPYGFSPDINHYDVLISNSDTFSNVLEIPLFNYPKKSMVIVNKIWISEIEGIFQYRTTDSTVWYLDVK